MRDFEFCFHSVNPQSPPKPIRVFVIEPDHVDASTGAMLFTHGWGRNRFQHQDIMQAVADQFNISCLSVEYRQSGYDFNEQTGAGWYVPYDASHYQVFDVLNALRFYLDQKPQINRRRLFHYGQSQGGHICLLSAIFAPSVFSFVYASSALTHIDKEAHMWAGREFFPYELSVRDVIEHTDKIMCDVFLEHGTTDATVLCENHTRALSEKLKAAGKNVKTTYYEGADHDLAPVITKCEAFKKMAIEPLEKSLSNSSGSFLDPGLVSIACADRIFTIDWATPTVGAWLCKWDFR